MNRGGGSEPESPLRRRVLAAAGAAAFIAASDSMLGGGVSAASPPSSDGNICPFKITWDVGWICEGLRNKQRLELILALKYVERHWKAAIKGWPIVPGFPISELAITLRYYQVRGSKARQVGAFGTVDDIQTLPATAGRIAHLPRSGTIEVNRCAIDSMLVNPTGNGNLGTVLLHEVGHVLGFGTLWEAKRLLRQRYRNPVFVGSNAMREYQALRQALPHDRPISLEPVPVENGGGWGTRWQHWREKTFGNELMSPAQCANDRLPSRLTLASLEDLGYVVNYGAADADYELPGAGRQKCVPLSENESGPIDPSCHYPCNSKEYLGKHCSTGKILMPPYPVD
jgi:hypothetical protein